MAFVGLAAMNPIATMSVLDSNRWRPVVYADTPRTKARYQKFLATKAQPGGRKAVLFLFGVTNLHKVIKDMERFFTVLVFDDVQNLHQLTKLAENFSIVDIEQDENGPRPRHLSPAELQDVVARAGGLPKAVPLLTQVTAALSKRKPSVLESTSRMPLPEAVPESGAQRLLSEVKQALETVENLPFQVVLDYYVKFLFRIVARSQITSNVTKKLPDEAKEFWGAALDFAASDVGLRMAHAFRALCTSTDPDYRVGHAISDYDLKPYSGDFLYFTAILPPNSSFEFLKELGDKADLVSSAKKKFVPPPEPEPPAKRGRKKA